MSTSPRQNDATSLLQSAVDLHRRGQMIAAERAYCALLDGNDAREEAGALLGMLLFDQRRIDEAKNVLTSTLSRFGPSVMALSALASIHIGAGEWEEADRLLTTAGGLAPEDADIHRNLGTARKNLGDLDGAVAAFRTSLSLRRGYGGRDGNLVDVATNRVKLDHDLAQIQLLALRYPHRKDFEQIAVALSTELSSFAARGLAPFQTVQFDQNSARRIGWFYNRLVHEPAVSAPQTVLRNSRELRKRSDDFDVGASHIVLDDFLTDDALAGLRQLCEEATFWYEFKDHGGHVGAYLDEGFDHPLVLAIAKELRATIPGLLASLTLKQAWAYKYDNRGAGTRVHADQAQFTLNLWITNDGANRDGGGGLIMTDVAAPDDWSFERYNADAGAIERFLRSSNARRTRIQHKANRAVLFKSRYFHATEAFQFGPAYTDRRINVSYMFGDER